MPSIRVTLFNNRKFSEKTTSLTIVWVKRLRPPMITASCITRGRAQAKQCRLTLVSPITANSSIIRRARCRGRLALLRRLSSRLYSPRSAKACSRKQRSRNGVRCSEVAALRMPSRCLIEPGAVGRIWTTRKIDLWAVLAKSR